MTKKQRIAAFAALGEYMCAMGTEIQQVSQQAYHKNAWFTPPNIENALTAFGRSLSTASLTRWLSPYAFDNEVSKVVGLILAGNIPLVGFHDILCALCAGFSIQVKPSSDDPVLTPHLLDQLIAIEPRFSKKISVSERLKNFDLVIATGNDNSARYFTYYFGQKPHIIRKNRNSAAILTGEETPQDLLRLGRDIFDYFGLGCRSVSKLFVPQGYDIARFFEGITQFSDIINHHKYANNYDYNKAIYLVNGDKHYDNGFLLIKPDQHTASPLAVVSLEEYSNREALIDRLTVLAPQLQCLVSKESFRLATPVVEPGCSQTPALDDYADGVNTLDFLAEHA